MGPPWHGIGVSELKLSILYGFELESGICPWLKFLDIWASYDSTTHPMY